MCTKFTSFAMETIPGTRKPVTVSPSTAPCFFAVKSQGLADVEIINLFYFDFRADSLVGTLPIILTKPYIAVDIRVRVY